MSIDVIKEEKDSKEIYSEIHASVISEQKHICKAVNSAMVIAYWKIGEQIYKSCGERYKNEN